MRFKEAFLWSLVPAFLFYVLPGFFFLSKSFIEWSWEVSSFYEYLTNGKVFRVIILLTITIFLYKYLTWYEHTYYIEDDDYPI